MRIRIIALGLLFLLSNGLMAESSKGADIAVSLYAFAYAPEHQDVFLTNRKGEAKEIRLSTANILGPYKTSMDENRVIRLRARETSAEGEVIYPVIAKIKIPLSIKEPLLILVPQKGEELYKALVIDRNIDNFPNGGFKVVNFSPRNVRGVIGETKVTAPAKKITYFNLSGNKERKLKVHFQYQRENDWKSFLMTSWIKKPDKRSLLCVYEEENTKRIRIKGIPVKPYHKTPRKAAVTE